MTRAAYTIRTPQQLGPVLRALRKQQGLTQAGVAQLLGISRQAYSALESRPESATFERLMKLWAVLDLEVSLDHRSAALPESPGW